MNTIDYPKQQIFFKITPEHNSSSIYSTWRGNLTKVTFIAIALGSYYLINKKVDLTEKGRRCFYALRKYFPKGKNEIPDEENSKSSDDFSSNNEICPVCLTISKTGLRASCGHFLCSKCLARYREVSCTKSPPCPLCRSPLKSITPSAAPALISKSQQPFVKSSNIICETITINEIGIENVLNNEENKIEDLKSKFLAIGKSRVSCYLGNLIGTINDQRNKLTRNSIIWNFLLILIITILRNFRFQFIGNQSILKLLIPGMAIIVPIIYTCCLLCKKDKNKIEIK